MAKLIKAFRLKCGTEIVGQVDDSELDLIESGEAFTVEKPIAFVLVPTPRGVGTIPVAFTATFKTKSLRLSAQDFYCTGDPDQAAVEIYMSLTSPIAMPAGSGGSALSLVQP